MCKSPIDMLLVYPIIQVTSIYTNILALEKKVKSANSIMAMIRRAFQFLTKDVFMLLYKGLVRNPMEYGEAVWSPYKVKDIERVEGVQRRATATLPGMKNKSYEQRLHK